MKTIQITVDAKEKIPHKQLIPFQDDLKTLGKEEYEKMRASFIKDGFSFVIHAWKNKGKTYIIDGHQRVFTVAQMEKIEKFKIPSLPVAYIQAKTYKEAKLRVLAGASQYGKMHKDKLFSFMKENGISLEALSSQYHFPEIDIQAISDLFSNIKIDVLPEAEAVSSQMKSGSQGVKQVQLYFEVDDFQEFMTKATELAKFYKTENVTDTVIEAIRAEHKAKTSKSK